MDLNISNYNLTDVSNVNVILGKNGSGKSTLLKTLDQGLRRGQAEVVYVTPERGGVLVYNSSVEQNQIQQPNWERDQKRKNQWENFKSNSVIQFKRLELLVLREIADDHAVRQDLGYNFDNVLSQINDLLTNIRIARSVKTPFEILSKSAGSPIHASQISSGESELISLAIECLLFEKSCVPGNDNYLLMDEPDVHLHPDLQANFMRFLLTLVQRGKFKVILATHSTAILGALLDFPDSRFGILQNGSKEVSFKPINEMYREILPVFGAHPLSNLFNQSPMLLLEGEDDVRIWQQAIRTAKGGIRIYPCSVGGNGNMAAYEESVKEIISGVYDNAKAYSLRDRDEGDEHIDDDMPIIRFKLSCRAAENLILCDEVLANIGVEWQELQVSIDKWIVDSATHSRHAIMTQFRDSGYDRKMFDLKEIRNVLIGLMPTNKSWEIEVGQTIGKFKIDHTAKDISENKLCNYLGDKLAGVIFD